jgi:hypothetical protein
MMWSRIAVLGLAGALGACADHPADNAAIFGSAAGTPFMLAFKLPVCVVTVALAAPLVGASGLAEPTPDTLAVRNGLAQGMAENCGPPYTLTP